MRLFILGLSAAALLLSASCKKSKSSSGPANSWKLGSVSYTTKYSTASAVAKQLIAMDAIPSGTNPSVNTCQVTFSALPTSGGTYKIVTLSAATLATNEVIVYGSTYSPGATYVSTGNDGVSATITVSGGKITASIPPVWVKKTGGTDSMQLSGTIIEM